MPQGICRRNYFVIETLHLEWEKLNKNGTEKEDQESINENRGPQLQYTSNWFAWNQIGIFKKKNANPTFDLELITANTIFKFWITFQINFCEFVESWVVVSARLVKIPVKMKDLNMQHFVDVKSGTNFRFCNERNVVNGKRHFKCRGAEPYFCFSYIMQHRTGRYSSNGHKVFW